MGQQQLLLILLGIIVVGVALLVGINYFRANAIEAKRNNIINELVNLASLAQNYYMKPKSIGGGSRSFIGWSIPPELESTANGSFKFTCSVDSVILIGTGNEIVTNNDSVKVRMSVGSTTYKVNIVN